jgi:hypothetical protein
MVAMEVEGLLRFSELALDSNLSNISCAWPGDVE